MRYDTEVRQRRLVEEIDALIRDNLAQHPSVQALAVATGNSAGYVGKVYRSVKGITLGTALRNEKMTQAKGCLENTRDDIKQIAYGCGFGNPDHFCAWFKRQTGMTPTQWRSSCDTT